MIPNNGKSFNFFEWILEVFQRNKVVVLVLFSLVIALGIYVAPFNWKLGFERDPIHVDAIPNIGANQQIVFTDWDGRSPKDIEDQITYPLLRSLMGIPGVEIIRGTSMFGYSSISIIFKDGLDFYWTRSRILEKLSSLSSGLLPVGVEPALGPDATSLGQVFEYTLEGKDKNGNPTGGWDLEELRTLQDWYVRYALLGSEGVSEVSSIGGYVKEYQINLNPDAMRVDNVMVSDVINAIQRSNIDIGANTIDQNGVEYIIRGVGYISGVNDIQNIVVKLNIKNIPIYLKNIANVSVGPALRRGILDKGGAEVVGGIATIRYGVNPLEAINNIKDKIVEISPYLPKKILADGTESHIEIVPFYDRSKLIKETLGTLNSAVFDEILITIIVILLMIKQLRISAIISLILPSAVLFAFVLMKICGVEANIVALSGIAIAIGAVVDVGIILCENILKKLGESGSSENRLRVIVKASSEVAGPILTSQLTTIVSFLPVFLLQHSEGKLFKPLAFTKTFTLFGAYILGMAVIPIFYYILIETKFWDKRYFKYFCILIAVVGIYFSITYSWMAWIVVIICTYYFIHKKLTNKIEEKIYRVIYWIVPLIFIVVLAEHWWPAGPEKSIFINVIFTIIPIAVVLGVFALIQHYYIPILGFCIKYKKIFLSIPLFILILGAFAWTGSNTILSFLPSNILHSKTLHKLSNIFPGLGDEFMPSLNEGSFLLMPSLMPQADIGEVKNALHKQDALVGAIPEVTSIVGKGGRAETALDPAPISMIESIINYKSKYLSDENGNYLRFKYDSSQNDYFRDVDGKILPSIDGKGYIVKGKFLRGKDGELLADSSGNVFRLWRPPLDPSLNPGRDYWKGIESPNDIWDEVVHKASMPGITSSPKLQPIETRIIMLQSGMRSNMGIEIKGLSQTAIENTAISIAKILQISPYINSSTVYANRTLGKPYLEIKVDREKAARYGVNVQDVFEIIETAIGGKIATNTVEGRYRFPVNVRYLRELRDNIADVEKMTVTALNGVNIPLGQIASVEYVNGPQMITSENGFLIGYVFFEKASGVSELDAVNEANKLLQKKIDDGQLKIPTGISFSFAGTYKSYLSSHQRLMVILPLVCIIILLILYFQYRSIIISAFIFSGVFVAWAGGFILLWLYSCHWFLNFDILGVNFRTLFNVNTVSLSVAVWVGFLALFGIATDEGVIIISYIKDTFKFSPPKSIEDVRNNIKIGGKRRVRATLMTAGTTILALIPVVTSTGRGSDLMVPMAIPILGGLLVVNISMFIVPVLLSILEEKKFKLSEKKKLEQDL